MSIFENFEGIESQDSIIPGSQNNLQTDDETVLYKEDIEEIELDERTRARGIALQVLFEMDMTDHPINVILKERLDAVKLEGGLPKFVESIVLGVAPISHEIDRFIAKYATEWPIEQIAVIDRNIIRIAVWEFAISEHTPLKVVINESVELAKVFGSESSQRFVNGVLGSLADHQIDIKTALEEI
ncbi:MAG: transcription antitermination factor NusB [Flexilinea flocculi]|nr:transcription antitermination factor NusB [Flexilinea flocculi]